MSKNQLARNLSPQALVDALRDPVAVAHCVPLKEQQPHHAQNPSGKHPLHDLFGLDF